MGRRGGGKAPPYKHFDVFPWFEPYRKPFKTMVPLYTKGEPLEEAPLIITHPLDQRVAGNRQPAG